MSTREPYCKCGHPRSWHAAAGADFVSKSWQRAITAGPHAGPCRHGCGCDAYRGGRRTQREKGTVFAPFSEVTTSDDEGRDRRAAVRAACFALAELAAAGQQLARAAEKASVELAALHPAISDVTQAELLARPHRFLDVEPTSHTLFTKEKKPRALRVVDDKSLSHAAPHLKAGALRMLRVLRADPPLTRRQLATLSRFRLSGTYSDYLTALKSAGCIVEPAKGLPIDITDEGIARAGDVELVTTIEQRTHRWIAVLKAGAARMFATVLTATVMSTGVRCGVTRADLAEKSGFKLSDVGEPSGTFSDYLTILRVNGLILEMSKGQPIIAGPELTRSVRAQSRRASA